jgi:hypothetical protein
MVSSIVPQEWPISGMCCEYHDLIFFFSDIINVFFVSLNTFKPGIADVFFSAI